MDGFARSTVARSSPIVRMYVGSWSGAGPAASRTASNSFTESWQPGHRSAFGPTSAPHAGQVGIARL